MITLNSDIIIAIHEQISDILTVLSLWGTQVCTNTRKSQWMAVWGRSCSKKLRIAMRRPMIIFWPKMMRKLSIQKESSTVESIMFSRTMQIWALRSIWGWVWVRSVFTFNKLNRMYSG